MNICRKIADRVCAKCHESSEKEVSVKLDEEVGLVGREMLELGIEN